MTKEQANKFKVWLDYGFKMMITGFITLTLFTVPKFMAEQRSLSFNTIDDKVNTMNHVNKSLSEMELHLLKGHVNNPDYHMPKNQKDSVYVLRKEFNELVDRLTVTNYQNKESVREILELIRMMNNKLDQIERSRVK